MNSHGAHREEQLRRLAGQLGVADFVFTAPPVRKGSAIREATGDGLLIVGDRGAILQVKSRDPARAMMDSPQRALSWIRKNAKKARDQGLGTRRELLRRQQAGTPIAVLPVRALDLEEDARRRYELAVTGAGEDWPVLVVLDHARCPEVDLGFQSGVVWITSHDWWELHRRLRSTSALLHYCRRIMMDQIHVPLGREADRYMAMRAADEVAAADSSSSVPFLADATDYDLLGVELYHDILDKVWPDDGVLPWRSAAEYREIVEFLDRVPPEMQAEAGRWFLRKRQELTGDRNWSSGLLRLNFQDRLVFSCSERDHWKSSEEWMAQVYALAHLRHCQALESGTPTDTKTLAIGALCEEREGRRGVSYFFVLLKGAAANHGMPPELRRNFEWRFGIHHHSDGTIVETNPDLEEPCPCMSGRQFKECCGT